ncbi:hypothetical protein U1Q18_040602 [Sarracenia purpurea var. burkii]
MKISSSDGVSGVISEGEDVEVDLPGRNVEEEGSGVGTLLASSTDSEIDIGEDRSKSVSDENGTESDVDDVGLDDVKNEDLFPLVSKEEESNLNRADTEDGELVSSLISTEASSLKLEDSKPVEVPGNRV